MLTRDRYEKPWTETPIKRRKYDYYIFWGGCLIGLIAGAFMCYQAWSGVPNNTAGHFLADIDQYLTFAVLPDPRGQLLEHQHRHLDSRNSKRRVWYWIIRLDNERSQELFH